MKMDKVKASLEAIGYMLNSLEDVIIQKGYAESEVIQKALKDDIQYYDELADELAALANDIGDFLNSQDMVCEEDERILNPLFEKINETV